MMSEIEKQQYLKHIDSLNAEIDAERLKSGQYHRDIGQMGQTSMFNPDTSTNLIQWQLDLEEEKEKIDHILRGHFIKRDKEGNEFWSAAEDPAAKVLTDHGVDQLMHVINAYLSRNHILSNYDEETINKKMLDLGTAIADDIFLSYETVFYCPRVEELMKRDRISATKFNTLLPIQKRELWQAYEEEKQRIYTKNKKKYEIITRIIIDAIHSAYLRALGGEERSSLRKTMHITQSESGSRVLPPKPVPQKFSLVNPRTWG